jgi:hypothetical protein
MNKVSKITTLTISVVILLLIGYFFLPKKQTKCTALGDGADDCTTCTCTRGFPIINAMFQQIGGKLEPDCFFGKTIDCKIESLAI